jgi:hypothetical protein
VVPLKYGGLTTARPLPQPRVMVRNLQYIRSIAWTAVEKVLYPPEKYAEEERVARCGVVKKTAR